MSLPRGSRAGFTLIELIVTVVVLSTLLLGVAAMMARTYRGGSQATASGYRNAELMAEVGRLTSLPYGYLAAGTTCASVTAAPFPHTTCSIVTFVDAEHRQVQVVVTPTASSLLTPDTVTFERGR